HRALVDVCRVDLGSGVESLVDDLAGDHVLEGGPHERGPLTGLDVLELDDGPELVVEVEHHAVLEVVRAGHCRYSCRSFNEQSADSLPTRQVNNREPVPIDAKATDDPGRYGRNDRMMAKLLTGVDVGQVHLHQRPLE